MDQVTAKSKQDFTIGKTVRIGGSFYRVVGNRPPPAKGQASIVELISPDLERRYEWQPFRGLKVVGAKPKRIRKRKAKGATVTQGPQRVERVSLWTRMVRVFSRH